MNPGTVSRRSLASLTALALLVTQLAIPPQAEASHLGSSTASAGSAPPPAATVIENFQPDLFTGRATTSIPIAVSPGRNGMQPSLALTYSSSSRNGWLGVGWSLDVGYIERSTKNGVPKYDTSDTYTFMFQGVSSDLVQIPDGTYRAKHEGAFLRVESKGLDGWEVKDKSGTRFIFGGTPDSEIRNASAQVFRWGLRKAIDTNGNYLSVIYTADQGQVYPVEIRYTGHEPTALLPPHRVAFTYEDRPDVDRSYRSGTLIATAKRLKEIAAYASEQLARKYVLAYTASRRTGRSLLTAVTHVGADGVTSLPSTTFTYQDGAPTSYTLTSNTTPTTSVAAWNLRKASLDTGHENGGCAHPYSGLPWGASTVVRSSADLGCLSATVGSDGSLSMNGCNDTFGHAWTFVYVGAPRTITLSLAEYAGSGVPQCLWREDASGVQQITGSSVSLQSGWSILHHTAYHQHSGWSVAMTSPLKNLVDLMSPNQFAAPQLAGDVNGDALTDLITFDTSKSPSEWRVAVGTGVGFRPETVWLTSPVGFADRSDTPVLGDFDGDGKTDIAAVNASNGWWHFARSTGAAFDAWAFASFPLAAGSPFVGDFDGNGKADLGVYNAGSWQIALRGSGIFTPTASFALTWGSSDQEPLTGDFNGDGLTDIAIRSKSSGEVRVRLSTGSSFGAETLWGTGITSSLTTTADFNGDGLTDLASYDAPSGQVSWAPSQGDRFGALQGLFGGFSLRTSDASFQVADANGDGLADPAVFRSATGSSEFALSTGATPDLLVGTTNGLGGATTIAYAPSTRLDNTGDDGLPDLPFMVPVVTQAGVSDGLGHTYATHYTYEDGLFDGPAKEFRGFRKVQAIDAEGNLAETIFSQGQAKQGRPLSIETRDAFGKVLTHQDNQWGTLDLFPGVQFTRLVETNAFTYDGDATFKQTRTEFTIYDTFGNLRKTIAHGDVAITGDERVTRTDYVYNQAAWIVGKPATIKVLSLDGLTKYSERTFFYDGNTSYTWDDLSSSWIPATPIATGQLTKEEEWLNPGTDPVTTLSYDAFGNVTTVTDALGRVTTNTYDATGTYLTQIANTLGHTRTLAYDARFGQVVSSTDQNGVQTKTAYDALGRVTQTSFIDPATLAEVITSKIEYDLVSRPLRTTTTVYAQANLQGPLTTYQFTDGLGRLIQTRTPAEDPAKQVVTGALEFNSRGLVAKQWVPYLSNTSASYVPLSQEPSASSLAAVSYAYDAAGRLTTVTDPDGSATTTSYNDWSTTVTDALGHKTTRTSDAYGRLLKVEEYNGAEVYTTTYAYDSLNNLTKLTDAKGNVTTIAYDQLSRKLSMTDPDMGVWTYTYDGVDNLKSQTDARGVKTSFTYDALNRLTQKSYTIPTGSGIPSPGAVTYSYDDSKTAFSKGRLTQITDGAGVSPFTYDALGRLTKETKKLDGTGYTIQRAYDLLGRLTTLTYPDGEKATYTYNAQGGIEAISLVPKKGAAQVVVSNLDYNAAGQVTKLAYGNGVVSDYSYNPQTLRLSSLLTRNASLATLQDFSYAFDPVGNVTSITDRIRTASQSFAYDDLNRLTFAQGSYGTFTYAYDPIGNMTNKEGVNQFYGLAGGTKPHAITSTSDGKTFAYDANGSRISQTAPAGTTTSTFDAESRLKQVTNPSGTTSFVYDGDGGRVKQTTSAGTTRYLGEAYEIAPSLTTTKYVFAGGLRLAAKDSTGATRFYHTDHLGSSNVITDKTGAIVEVAEYTPYGSLSRREGSANVPQKFTGQRLDASTGLYFFNARYYDPTLGRFTQPDPFVQAPANPQTLNRYSYVLNNPLRYIDPSGYFFQFLIPILIAAFVGGVVGGITSVASGGSFWKGAGIGALTGATFTAGAMLAAAALPTLVGPAIAGSALGKLGISLVSIGTGGALSNGLASTLQGGSFGEGAAWGAFVSVATFGAAKLAGPVFAQLGEVVGPRLAQAGEAFTNSSVGQQLQRFLARTGLGSQGARASVALSEDTIPAGYRLLAPRGAINAPVEFTKPGETFIRVSANPQGLNFSFRSPGGAQAGTYAFPEDQFLKFQNNPLTIKYFGDLPGAPPSIYGRITPPSGTPIQRGIVPGGQFGGSGGAQEVYFPDEF